MVVVIGIRSTVVVFIMNFARSPQRFDVVASALLMIVSIVRISSALHRCLGGCAMYGSNCLRLVWVRDKEPTVFLFACCCAELTGTCDLGGEIGTLTIVSSESPQNTRSTATVPGA